MSGTEKQDKQGTQSGTDTTAQEIAALKAEISDLRKEATNYCFLRNLF